MEAKKARKKYVGFSAQREQCRLNKYTYTEKCSCGMVTLMCNYPFTEPAHKKGVCRANTCTDMRTLPDEIVEADRELSGSPAETDEAPALTEDANKEATYEEGHKEAEESLGNTEQ